MLSVHNHQIQQNCLLGICPKDALSQLHNDVCIRVFILAWFVIEKNRKRLKYPLIGDWLW